MSSLNSLYESYVVSIEELFTKERTNWALNIPDYQRNYKWRPKEEIQRLIQALLYNFNKYSENKKNCAFFGSIIFSKSEKKMGLVDIYDVVDGQQRITTISIFASCFYSLLKSYKNDKFINDAIVQNWIVNEIDRTLSILRLIIACPGKDVISITLYPRLVRDEDERKNNNHESFYNSSISKFENDFIKKLKDNNYDFPEDISDLQEFNDIFKNFKNILVNINNKKVIEEDEDYDYLEPKKLDRAQFISLFNDSTHAQKFIQLNKDKTFIKILLLANYFCTKCGFSLTVTDDSNAAFDIFDSLNTTGLPLTALETLRPQVLMWYKNSRKNFQGSSADLASEEIANIFSNYYDGTDKQQTEIKKIITASGLYISGDKIGENLSEQRQKIRNIQDDAFKENNPDIVLKSISEITQYRCYFNLENNIKSLIPSKLKNINLEDVKIIQLISKLFLDAKTHLSIPPLTRYWEKGNIENDHSEYFEFSKALVSFFVLRRFVTGTTDRIDTCFRELMSGDKSFDGLKVSLDGIKKLPTLKSIKEILIEKLNTKSLKFDLSEKDIWVNYVYKQNLYEKSRHILRFLLLISHHNTGIDNSEVGLITRKDIAIDSKKDFLNYDVRMNPLYASLEHVAPSNPKSQTDYKDVYQETFTKHSLGNFVLIPQAQNINLSNNSWEIKKLYFSALSESRSNDRENKLNNLNQLGVSFSQSRIKELIKEPSSYMLDGLDKVKDWDKDFIEKRSKRLSGLAWDILVDWLKPN